LAQDANKAHVRFGSSQKPEVTPNSKEVNCYLNNGHEKRKSNVMEHVGQLIVLPSPKSAMSKRVSQDFGLHVRLAAQHVRQTCRDPRIPQSIQGGKGEKFA
jgi:hypothetical protein